MFWRSYRFAPKFNTWRIAFLVLKHETAKSLLRLARLSIWVVVLLLIARVFA